MNGFIVALLANFVVLSINGQTIAFGPRLNPCEQLAQCLAKYDSIASMDCVTILPNAESASQENVGGDSGTSTSSDKGSPENSKLPEAVGTCLEDMRSGLDSLRQKMAERLQFYSKCLTDQAANQTTEALLADMNPRQVEKCKMASADVSLDDTCRFVDKQKSEKEKSDKDSKKKKKRESDEPKVKENLVTPATTPCGAQKRYVVKQCEKVAKCCPVLETCRLNFELSDTHKDLTRTKLSVITQRQKCILMAKKVDLESSKLDQILGEDIFNESGMFI